jgi:hypothetical protein
VTGDLCFFSVVHISQGEVIEKDIFQAVKKFNPIFRSVFRHYFESVEFDPYPYRQLFLKISCYRINVTSTGFVVDEAVPGQVILRKLRVSSVRIIPPSLQAQILFIYYLGYTNIEIDKLIDRLANQYN